MSDIAPVNGAPYERPEPITPVSRPIGLAEPAPVPGPRLAGRPSDRVDISERARLLSRLAAMPEIRQELVDQVRRQIADGTYETDDKLDEALAALAEDLDG